MAKAGVSYTVWPGREDNKQYGNETYNGAQLRDKHQFPDGIDPYKIAGKPESGLVWGVSNGACASPMARAIKWYRHIISVFALLKDLWQTGSRSLSRKITNLKDMNCYYAYWQRTPSKASGT